MASAIASPQIAKICGLPILAHTLEEILELFTHRIQHGTGTWIVTVNLEMVSRGKRDPGYAELLRKADLFVADGMPIVWASRKKKGVPPVPERVTGVEITQELLKRVPAEQVAIVGGEDPLKTLEYMGVAGREKILVDNGRISLEPEAIQLRAKELAGRRLIFVALGVPKQDKLALALRELLPEATFIGVGGTFELLGGQKPRAPQWMQKSGLEWVFRVCAEPKRLWRRYFVEYWGGGFALLRDIRQGAR